MPGDDIFRHLDAEAQALLQEFTTTTTPTDLQTLLSLHSHPQIFRPQLSTLLNNLPVDLVVGPSSPTSPTSSFPTQHETTNASYRCPFPNCTTWTLIPYTTDPFFPSLSRILHLASSSDDEHFPEAPLIDCYEKTFCQRHGDGEKEMEAMRLAVRTGRVIEAWRDEVLSTKEEKKKKKKKDEEEEHVGTRENLGVLDGRKTKKSPSPPLLSTVKDSADPLTPHFIRHSQSAQQRIIEEQSLEIQRLREENLRLREETKSFNEEYMNGH
ncbi:Hypothetical predicted protein [Lecanosticta acicola]|uniref:Uncharacterized protein n=1 Tax=Lecanosticta acicola TaxID=111012 RepID=A0AAI8YXR0_9PEZI|nr:Hypothetical predicted protein [Lecanosticta acicola]